MASIEAVAPAITEAKKGKVAKPKAAPKKKAAPSHPTFSDMITEAIVALKERTGSSQYAIQKFVEEKHKALPATYKKLLLNHLKKLVAAEKLVKVKNSYKLPPTRSDSSAAPKKPAAAAAKPKVAVKPKAKTAVAAKPKAKIAAAKPKTVAKVKAVAKPKAKAKAAAKPVKAKTAVKKAAPAKVKKVVAAKKPKSVKSPAKKKARK